MQKRAMNNSSGSNSNKKMPMTFLAHYLLLVPLFSSIAVGGSSSSEFVGNGATIAAAVAETGAGAAASSVLEGISGDVVSDFLSEYTSMILQRQEEEQSVLVAGDNVPQQSSIENYKKKQSLEKAHVASSRLLKTGKSSSSSSSSYSRARGNDDDDDYHEEEDAYAYKVKKKKRNSSSNGEDDDHENAYMHYDEDLYYNHFTDTFAIKVKKTRDGMNKLKESSSRTSKLHRRRHRSSRSDHNDKEDEHVVLPPVHAPIGSASKPTPTSYSGNNIDRYYDDEFRNYFEQTLQQQSSMLPSRFPTRVSRAPIRRARGSMQPHLYHANTQHDNPTVRTKLVFFLFLLLDSNHDRNLVHSHHHCQLQLQCCQLQVG
jgi:hypothetical protein